MLQKRFRLKDASLFQKAFRSGKPFFFGDIACKAIFLDGARVKIGFSVSKKLFPRAVDRNTVKRVLADSIQELYEKIPSGWQIVFFPRKKTSINKESAKKSVSEIIHKVSRIKTQVL
jgi:ribonuclease P protein component